MITSLQLEAVKGFDQFDSHDVGAVTLGSSWYKVEKQYELPRFYDSL